MARQPSAGDKDILIEFVVQGSAVRVTAIHAGSGTEATIVGPATAPRKALEAAALRKLTYVLERKRGAT